MQNDKKMTAVWLGVAIGAAVGVGFAISRNVRRSRWDSARSLTRKVANHSGDLADRSKDIIERAQNMYKEGRRIVEDATELWSEGRRLVRV